MIIEQVKFASERAKKFVLDTVDFRVPIHNDLYINKHNLVQRKKREVTSRSAQKRVIVKESWL
jgi:hypothetical protein